MAVVERGVNEKGRNRGVIMMSIARGGNSKMMTGATKSSKIRLLK